MISTAHGTPSKIEFGYDTKNADTYRFDKEDLAKINSKAFKQSAVVNSFACRTGASNDDPNGNVQPEKSLAQGIADKTGATVYAFQKRTDYENILPADNRNLSQKIWEKAWGGGDKTYDKDRGKWDTDEAIDKVKFPTEGTTPANNPKGTFLFVPTKPKPN